MIKEAEVRGAELYHSKRCFFLVNGSTCGLLAAISAATRRGDKVLVARNCHKAVYHALYMNELQAEYLYPSITKNGIQQRCAMNMGFRLSWMKHTERILDSEAVSRKMP